MASADAEIFVFISLVTIVDEDDLRNRARRGKTQAQRQGAHLASTHKARNAPNEMNVDKVGKRVSARSRQTRRRAERGGPFQEMTAGANHRPVLVLND